MSEPDAGFRQALIDAMTGAFYEPDKFDIEAEVMLDALLPVLAAYIAPHRWDIQYPGSADQQCHPSVPDTFYAGVLHASAVVRDLIPPKPRQTTHKAAITRTLADDVAAGLHDEPHP